MNRLTMRNNNLRLAIPKEAYENYDGNRPLDCSSFCDTQQDCMECPIGACFDKLADYEDSEEEKRLIELPFKMTQEIYTIFNHKIVKGQFAGIYFKGINTWYAWDQFAYDVVYKGMIIHVNELFGTREEAEEKLKESEENQ